MVMGSDHGASLNVDRRRINSLLDQILSLNGIRTFSFDDDETTTIQRPHYDGGVEDEEESRDRISILPDDLLHHILSFVPTQDAVRTSALSRRWQRVWIGLPTLALGDDRSTAAFAESVDKVLALAHSHYVREGIEISLAHPPHLARANQWLQQLTAAAAAARSISIIFFREKKDCDRRNEVVLELPSCASGRTTSMTLDFCLVGVGTLVIPPAVASAPSSLTQLELKNLRVDGGALSHFVSSCCPHLRKLALRAFGYEDAVRVSNDALEDLELGYVYGRGGLRRLEVSCRNLRRLCIITLFSPEVMAHLQVHDGSKAACFRTPRLEDLTWSSSAMIHPSRVEFAHSLATVRRLVVGLCTHAMVHDHHNRFHRNKLSEWLLQRCTAVLSLRVHILNLLPRPFFLFRVLDGDEAWLAQYEDLMVAVPQLSTVTDLTVRTLLDHHKYGASIATLLSRCRNLETLTVIVDNKRHESCYVCGLTTACWCKRPADWREQKLFLDFLRQVDLKGFTSVDWLPELVSLLRRSRPALLITTSEDM